MDMLKAKINSNIAHKPKKGLPMDKLQTRQNEFLLQLQAIYALHCSFAILFFLSFLCQSLSSLSLSLFSIPFSAKTFGWRRLSLSDSIVSNLELDHQEIDQISCTATGNDPGLGDVQVELSIWRRERVCLKRSSATLNGGGFGHLGDFGFHEFWF